MLVRALNAQMGATLLAQSVSLRCPACRQIGTFERPPVGVSGQSFYELQIGVHVCGMRVCPNYSCRALLFIIWDSQKSQLAASYPPEYLDFDSMNIPAPITKALEEAIVCHAHSCFIASAIMVRKTLEELCHDRTAVGPNLKERLRSLGAKTLLPKELLDGLDDLRLLGNDAAHIESQEFNVIGQTEVEIGIQFAKEVLKAVFQYADLLAKLRSLKRTP